MCTFWNDGDDLLHFLFEPDLQYPISLVYHERFDVLEHKAFRVLELEYHQSFVR